jgi:hypothetical protein
MIFKELSLMFEGKGDGFGAVDVTLTTINNRHIT